MYKTHKLRGWLTLVLLLSMHCAGVAQHKTVKVFEQTGSAHPANPTIAINRKRPGNIVLGTGSHVFYSLDSGKTWLESKSSASTASLEDPVMVADSKGTFSLFRVSPGDKSTGFSEIVHQVSIDGGKTWDAVQKMSPTPSMDEWMPRADVHYQKGSVYLTWNQADHRVSKDTSCQSNLWFASSSNDEKRWSVPVRINAGPGDCNDADNLPLGTAPVINAEGRLFVAWSNHGSIFFDRSYDGGKTWLSRDIVIGSRTGGSALSVPGIQRCQSAPVLAVDNSSSFFRSSLYLVWADQAVGENDTDIRFTLSTKRGDLWSTPIRINQEKKGHQFLPSMAVDDHSGIIYILYYDRRAYDDLQTDVYLAYSVDGGIKFKEKKLSETPFIPNAEAPFSDRVGLVAAGGIIAAVWTRQDDGHNSVITVVLKQSDLITKDEAPRIQQIRH